MKGKKCFAQYILPFFLFLYPMRKIIFGVDLMDGGYNCGNFVYHDLKYMDSMWYFATWISNSIGHIFTMLPFGDSLLGVNFYTALLPGAMAVSAYVFCRKKFEVSPFLLFLAELLALSLCWAPSVILYSYLTYVVIFSGTLCLYRGLTGHEPIWLFLAGAFFGLGVGVRFSNLAHVAFIAAVWAYSFLEAEKGQDWGKTKNVKISFQEKLRNAGRRTAVCILGYVAGIGSFLLFISIRYGFSFYLESVLRLFDMTREAETVDYKSTSMLTGFFREYLSDTGTYWIKRFLLIFVVEVVLCLCLPKKLEKLKKALVSILTAAFFLWICSNRFVSFDYHVYGSFLYPCLLVLFFVALFCGLFLADGRTEPDDRLLACLLVLILYVSSIGGNNAVYASINNLFFVLPCFCGLAHKYLKNWNRIYLFPIKTLLAAGVCLLFVQGIFFGNVFVYEEATGARVLDGKITGIPVLEGMRTTAPKAAALEGLYVFLQKNGVEEEGCILYGNIPGLAYFMGIAPRMNTWGDLPSYVADEMGQKLEEIRRDGGSMPIVIICRDYAEYYKDGNREHLPGQNSSRAKYMELCRFMEEEGYPHMPEFENGMFAVFVSAKD